MRKAIIALTIAVLAGFPALASAQTEAVPPANGDVAAETATGMTPPRVAAIVIGGVGIGVAYNILARLPLLSTVMADLGHGILFVAATVAGGFVGNWYFNKWQRGEELWPFENIAWPEMPEMPSMPKLPSILGGGSDTPAEGAAQKPAS